MKKLPHRFLAPPSPYACTDVPKRPRQTMSASQLACLRALRGFGCGLARRICTVRIHATRHPRSRNSRTSLFLGETPPSKISLLRSNPRISPDSRLADQARVLPSWSRVPLARGARRPPAPASLTKATYKKLVPECVLDLWGTFGAILFRPLTNLPPSPPCLSSQPASPARRLGGRRRAGGRPS